jgi:fucose permease
MTVFALLGATALWLLYAWLLSAIVASYLAGRKGYNEKTGLAFGLLLHVIGVIVWLVWPAKPDSKWKTLGPWGTSRSADSRPADAE